MTAPVPDSPFVDTPYGRRGPYWSCDRDANGDGKHTGADFGAPLGTRVVAARPGRLVHVNFGSAFGGHQVAVECDGGTRDFYAHMRSRVAEQQIRAGEKVGEIGAEGNVTGPHLHFERHAVSSGPWSCGIVRDPQPSIDWEEDNMTPDELRAIVREEIENGWARGMPVTQPGSGDDVNKPRQQVLRELWQKVTRAT